MSALIAYFVYRLVTFHTFQIQAFLKIEQKGIQLYI